jgi:hypothetical protein
MANPKILHAAYVVAALVELVGDLAPKVIAALERGVDAPAAAAAVLDMLGEHRVGKVSPRTLRFLTLGIAYLVEDLNREAAGEAASASTASTEVVPFGHGG